MLLDGLAVQRSLVVIVSDFRGPIDWRNALLRIAGRHPTLAVEIRDPREQELADVGELRLVDPETGRQLRVDTSDRNLRDRFAAAAAEERTGLVRMLSAAGVRHVALSTEGDWLRDLAAFLRRSDRLMLFFFFSFKSPWLLLFLLARPGRGRGLHLARAAARREGREVVVAGAASEHGQGLAGRPQVHPGDPLRRSRSCCSCVGFARPQAKFNEAKDGATVVLMVDTSGSMGANDVKPTRLLAADAALTDFVNKLPVALPRGADHVLERDRGEGAADLRPQGADQGPADARPQLEGTALGDALSQAVKVAKKAVGPSKPGSPHPPASILLVSDGGNNAGRVKPARPRQQAQEGRRSRSRPSRSAPPRASSTRTSRSARERRRSRSCSRCRSTRRCCSRSRRASGGHFYAATDLERASTASTRSSARDSCTTSSSVRSPSG